MSTRTIPSQLSLDTISLISETSFGRTTPPFLNNPSPTDIPGDVFDNVTLFIDATESESLEDEIDLDKYEDEEISQQRFMKARREPSDSLRDDNDDVFEDATAGSIGKDEESSHPIFPLMTRPLRLGGRTYDAKENKNKDVTGHVSEDEETSGPRHPPKSLSPKVKVLQKDPSGLFQVIAYNSDQEDANDNASECEEFSHPLFLKCHPKPKKDQLGTSMNSIDIDKDTDSEIEEDPIFLRMKPRPKPLERERSGISHGSDSFENTDEIVSIPDYEEDELSLRMYVNSKPEDSEQDGFGLSSQELKE